MPPVTTTSLVAKDPASPLVGLGDDTISETVPLYYYTDAAQVLRILRPDAQVLNQADYANAVSDLTNARSALAAADADSQATSAQEDTAREQDAKAQVALQEAQVQAQKASNALFQAQQNQAAADQAKQLFQDQITTLQTSLTASPNDATLQSQMTSLKSHLAAATLADTQATAQTTLAQSAQASASAALTSTDVNAKGVQQRIQDADAAVTSARSALSDKRKAVDLAVRAQLGAQTALAGIYLDYEAVPIDDPDPQHKLDPLRHIYIRTAGASTLFLRGSAEYLRYAREAIAQLDTPVPQARATLWTIQLNSQDSQQRRNHLTAMQNAIDRIENQMGVLRDQLSGGISLFQNCVQAEVENADTDGDGPEWPPTASPTAPGLAPSHLRSIFNFYDPSILKLLPPTTYSQRYNRPDEYLNPYHINSLGEILFTLLMASEEYRKAALQAYLNAAPAAMAQIEDAANYRQDQPLIGKENPAYRSVKLNDLQKRYRDSYQMTELLAAFGYRLERNPDGSLVQGDGYFKVTQIAPSSIAPSAEGSSSVRRQQEYVVDIITSVLKAKDKEVAEEQLGAIATQMTALDAACATLEDERTKREALIKNAPMPTIPIKKPAMAKSPSKSTKTARSKIHPPAVAKITAVAKKPTAGDPQLATINTQEHALFVSVRLWIKTHLKDLRDQRQDVTEAPPYDQHTDTKAQVEEALAYLFVDRFAAIKSFGKGGKPYQLFLDIETPSVMEVQTAEQMKTFVRQLSIEEQDHSALTAIGDQIIKRYVVATEDDLDTEIIRPRLDVLHEAVGDPAIELGIVARTSLLSGDRRTASVDPRASIEFDFPKPPDLLKEVLDLAKLAVKPAATAGAGAAAQTLAALAGGGQGGLLNSLQDLSSQTVQPEPQIYQIQTGNGFDLTPILLPDAQNVAFDLSYVSSSPVREPSDFNGRHVAQVERHALHTYVQDSSYEVRELSRFESNTNLVQPVIRSGGLPLLRELPILRDIPLIGWFTKTSGRGNGLQESLIFVHTVQYPTVRNLIPLF